MTTAALGLFSPMSASIANTQSEALPYHCIVESDFNPDIPDIDVEISGSATAPASAGRGTEIELTDVTVNVQFSPPWVHVSRLDGFATLGPGATEVELGSTGIDDEGHLTYSGATAEMSAPDIADPTMAVTLNQVVHHFPNPDGLILATITCTPIGDAVVLAEVELTGQANFCAAPCSLDQIVEFDAVGAPLTMAQAGSSVGLEAVTLDGGPQPAGGALNEVTVTNRRGDGAPWSLTGQVSDFTVDQTAPTCPAGDPATRDYLCIPGDNLGWEPVAALGHDQVPGDVAAAAAGSTIAGGLGGAAQSLCSSPATGSGGTFTCGAALSLFTPASAAAAPYAATLTLTLA